jgi:hypothetical protein
LFARDMYYGNLTLAAGVTLYPNGFRVFVHDLLTLGDNAAIRRDGAAGAAMSAGTLGVGGTGQLPNPCNPTGGNVSNALGGNAGSLSGTTYGTATPPTALVGGPQIFDSVTNAITGRTLDGNVVNGGAGGDYCTAPSEVNGGGGGVIVLVARLVALSGAGATISANGAMGDSGEISIGGGGGVIVVVTTSAPPSGLTLSVAGGTGWPLSTPGTSGNTYWLN